VFFHCRCSSIKTRVFRFVPAGSASEASVGPSSLTPTSPPFLRSTQCRLCTSHVCTESCQLPLPRLPPLHHGRPGAGHPSRSSSQPSTWRRLPSSPLLAPLTRRLLLLYVSALPLQQAHPTSSAPRPPRLSPCLPLLLPRPPPAIPAATGPDEHVCARPHLPRHLASISSCDPCLINVPVAGRSWMSLLVMSHI
jgi:hypothetical protein